MGEQIDKVRIYSTDRGVIVADMENNLLLDGIKDCDNGQVFTYDEEGNAIEGSTPSYLYPRQEDTPVNVGPGDKINITTRLTRKSEDPEDRQRGRHVDMFRRDNWHGRGHGGPH